jgi:predicted enzyme related to lactoylglutathione lyase
VDRRRRQRVQGHHDLEHRRRQERLLRAEPVDLHDQLSRADLAALLAALRAEGCNVLDKTDDSEYGKFGWVMDPEGNKVELWQPPPGS